ncbi:hypothetical protein [Daejeonella sp.]|uniref:hypothetical protein n=1 Tax=Daejeonella sp. TaxID=2805397 RepID=UPI0039836FFD
MKRIKRSLGVALSVVLLLSFSVTLIPLDFFHNHQTSETSVPCVKGKAQSSCTHKLHITKKADFCWACAVHFDKSFTKISFIEKLKLAPGISLFINNDTAGYFIECLFTGLRGPPTE